MNSINGILSGDTTLYVLCVVLTVVLVIFTIKKLIKLALIVLVAIAICTSAITRSGGSVDTEAIKSKVTQVIPNHVHNDKGGK